MLLPCSAEKNKNCVPVLAIPSAVRSLYEIELYAANTKTYSIVSTAMSSSRFKAAHCGYVARIA
jgi:hypothetical protein